MPAKRELESGLLDQPAMCTTVNSLHTGILETYRYIGDIQVYWRHTELPTKNGLLRRPKID